MTEPFHIKTNSAIHRHGHNMNLPFVYHGVKQKFVKRSSIREHWCYLKTVTGKCFDQGTKK